MNNNTLRRLTKRCLQQKLVDDIFHNRVKGAVESALDNEQSSTTKVAKAAKVKKVALQVFEEYYEICIAKMLMVLNV